MYMDGMDFLSLINEKFGFYFAEVMAYNLVGFQF
jgi:hypothetical protein